MVEPLLIATGALALWKMLQPPSNPVDALVAQAMPVVQQHIANGVPEAEAMQMAMDHLMTSPPPQVTQTPISSTPPPPPLPLTYSSTPVQITPGGPVLSLSDPRIAQAAAQAVSGAMFATGISAAGMPSDVKNALVAKGWTWMGSFFNPGVLYAPGTPQDKIVGVAGLGDFASGWDTFTTYAPWVGAGLLAWWGYRTGVKVKRAGGAYFQKKRRQVRAAKAAYDAAS